MRGVIANLIFIGISLLTVILTSNYWIELMAVIIAACTSVLGLYSLRTQLMQKQTELEALAKQVGEVNNHLEEERKRYQLQKETLQSIIDSVGKGLVMSDTSGKIILINKIWQKIFRYDQVNNGDVRKRINETLSVETIIEDVVIGVTDSEHVSAELKALVGDYETNYRKELEYKESIHRYCRISSLPCQDSKGQALGRIYLFRDITHYKEVDLLKSELISTVSHELRTPMSSIMGFSELLLTRQLSPERSRQYIEIIHEQANRLTKLISDFLDIQRMESGRLIFDSHRLNFVQVIEQALNMFSNSQGKFIFVTDYQEESLDVHGDHDKLLQLMSNLISNALKYSPQGGKITIRAFVQADKLQVSVSDQGLGIPEEAQLKLFSKFFRVNNDDRREIGGTGLGLAICKEIVQAHKGQIGVESTYGRGSTFYFTLPLAEPILARGNPNSIVVKCEDEKNKDTILIVEDDEYLVNLIETILREDGFAVYSVQSGEAALEVINQIDFKIAILDIRLAGKLTGWDVLKALKNNAKTVNIPVIISSVYENSRKSHTNLISDYLLKPFKPEQLLGIVHKVMRENVEAKMLIQGDESFEEHIVSFLRHKGIKVKEVKRNESILMITMDGDS
jgi:signal transduction histidine kinase/FixJ family two-component response regulator